VLDARRRADGTESRRSRLADGETSTCAAPLGEARPSVALTPGMIMTAVDLLSRPDPTDDEIRHAIGGTSVAARATRTSSSPSTAETMRSGAPVSV
jgi:hypothetical protein